MVQPASCQVRQGMMAMGRNGDQHKLCGLSRTDASSGVPQTSFGMHPSERPALLKRRRRLLRPGPSRVLCKGLKTVNTTFMTTTRFRRTGRSVLFHGEHDQGLRHGRDRRHRVEDPRKVEEDKEEQNLVKTSRIKDHTRCRGPLRSQIRDMVLQNIVKTARIRDHTRCRGASQKIKIPQGPTGSTAGQSTADARTPGSTSTISPQRLLNDPTYDPTGPASS